MEPEADEEFEIDAGDEWGPQMAIPGYITGPAPDQYAHRVGGDSWTVVDPRSPTMPPVLLLTLDLRDPRLAALRMEEVDELPLAFHINCEWPERQLFRIEPEGHTAHMVDEDVAHPVPLPERFRFPDPLPETRVRLRPMTRADWPLDWDSYERLQEEFNGGPNFLRVLGPPVWIDLAEEVACTCGAPMPYVCGIGSEVKRPETKQLSGYIPAREFHFGNGVFYYFLCRRCRQIAVTWQGT